MSIVTGEDVDLVSILFFFLSFFSLTSPSPICPSQAYSASVRGAVKGGVAGLGVGLAGGALLQWKSPLWRNLTIPGKVFVISSAAVAGFWIGGDKALLSHVRDPKKIHSPAPAAAAAAATIADGHEHQQLVARPVPTFLGVEQRTWLKYRYHIVAATWVGSVAGSLAWTMRQSHLRVSQRLIQARVYAQFVTIACLLGTAALAQMAEVPTSEDEEETALTRKRRY